MTEPPSVPPEPSSGAAWHAVGTMAELQTHGVLEGLAGGRIVAVFLDGDRLHAIEANCAHQGGPLAKGCVEGGTIICPWHGWRYRLADGVNIANGQAMLEVFPVRNRDGMVEVQVALPPPS